MLYLLVGFHQLIHPLSDFAGLSHLVEDFWHDLTRHHLFDGYRPERHYMRGPGPAWQAKHRPSTGF